jgi:hypothetical protein
VQDGPLIPAEVVRASHFRRLIVGTSVALLHQTVDTAGVEPFLNTVVNFGLFFLFLLVPLILPRVQGSLGEGHPRRSVLPQKSDASAYLMLGSESTGLFSRGERYALFFAVLGVAHVATENAREVVVLDDSI